MKMKNETWSVCLYISFKIKVNGAGRPQNKTTFIHAVYCLLNAPDDLTQRGNKDATLT